MTTAFHSDSLTAILLCSRLAMPNVERDAAKPLSSSQWHSLVAKLRLSPWEGMSDLFEHDAAEIERTLGVKPESAERIVRLLERGGQVAFELERLANHGIWVLTEADDRYPVRLAERLGEQAPPVLCGAGPIELLSGGGIAIAGSRDLDPLGEAFARAFSARCASESVTVISGGARGADRISMAGALEVNGHAVGVLAESLEQTLRDRETGRFIRDERLALVSPFHPSAGFSVGNAMARNKILYCLADLAVVISSAEGSGGTWAGATENLRHEWVPLFVRAGADAPPGNGALIAAGGLPLLLDDLPPAGALAAGLRARAVCRSSTDGGDAVQGSAADDPSDALWPSVEALLSEPKTEGEIAAALALDERQARALLTRAIDEGRAVYASKRPRRYQRAPPRLL